MQMQKKMMANAHWSNMGNVHDVWLEKTPAFYLHDEKWRGNNAKTGKRQQPRIMKALQVRGNGLNKYYTQRSNMGTSKDFICHMSCCRDAFRFLDDVVPWFSLQRLSYAIRLHPI